MLLRRVLQVQQVFFSFFFGRRGSVTTSAFNEVRISVRHDIEKIFETKSLDWLNNKYFLGTNILLKDVDWPNLLRG